ncbi:hypothetical protein DPMN_030883 [Dreissena polymorpha]|uniref:Uncharacterized protein n=1 Tax=Dreissena polymorpha TaxID=45954 RepID=A0A9D4RHH8_DREPO|nr:hypothetical protein DPMN_030883 [Dreissena polymorpha]
MDVTNALDKNAVDHDLPPPYAEFANFDPPTTERNTDVNEYDPFDGFVNDSAGFHGNEFDELEFVVVPDNPMNCLQRNLLLIPWCNIGTR